MSASKADELRRLAQAVVDAEAKKGGDLLEALDDYNDAVADPEDTLAALDDATAQGRAAGDAAGYARAMREVVEYVEVYPICTGKWLAKKAAAWAVAGHSRDWPGAEVPHD